MVRHGACGVLLWHASDTQRVRWVRAGYANNGRHVNHYLVSFLNRIADKRDGLNLEPMLYQVRLRLNAALGPKFADAV